MSKKDKSKVNAIEPQVNEETADVVTATADVVTATADVVTATADAVNGVSVETEAEKLEKFKKAKREAAERFKERRAKEKAERIVNAKALIDELKNGGYWDKISDNGKAFLSGLTSTSISSGSNQSLFKTLFGDNPQVGASFTLNEAFQKTLKGKSNLDFYVKRWAEKGIVVSYKQDADNILNSVYTLEAIGHSVPTDAE